MQRDLAATYLRWTFLRAVFARAWWLTTALYLVVDAGLSPVQLVLIGTFQSLTVLVAEVPAGVLADSVSRRLAVVLAHAISGTGMAMAGLVSSFPLLVVANCLWGMGWAFASGADVAWITDELDEPGRIDRVLSAQGRWDLLGNPVGMAVAAAVAWATSLATAMICAGAGMVALGFLVARWPETGAPQRSPDRSWRDHLAILRQGVLTARRDRVVLAMLGATAFLNGGHEGFGRLRERRFVLLGMPTSPDPIAWFALLGVGSVAVGVLILRFVERRIDRADTARRAYVWACLATAVGLVVFAFAPNVAVAAAAALAITGTLAAIRVAATVRVNRRTASEVRATVHSLLSWSENLGEVVFGLALAIVAGLVSASAAIVGSAVLLVAAAVTAQQRDDLTNRRAPAL